MIKRTIRQIHRVLGLTLGLVLAVMGLTGATMAFEDQIMEAISPGIVNVPPRDAPLTAQNGPLTPDELIASFAAQKPGATPTVLVLHPQPGESAHITYRPVRAEADSGAPAPVDKLYLDPYSGRILGKAHGEAFFEGVRNLHRFLLLPAGIGRQIVGAAALSMIFFALSGLYLRWPRRPLDWKAWLKPDFSRPGAALYLSLHQVAGTCLFLVYLIIAPAGLTWAYDWWRDGATAVLGGGAPATDGEEARPAAQPGTGRGAVRGAEGRDAGVVPPLDPAWRAVQADAPDGVSLALITLPRRSGAPVQVRYLDRDAPNPNAFNALTVDAAGAVIRRSRYADQPLGARILLARLSVHRGSFFGLTGAIVFMAAAAAIPLFPATGYLLYLGRRARKAGARRTGAAQGAGRAPVQAS